MVAPEITDFLVPHRARGHEMSPSLDGLGLGPRVATARIEPQRTVLGGLEHLFFPYIGNKNSKSLIFFRVFETTNQRALLEELMISMGKYMFFPL